MSNFWLCALFAAASLILEVATGAHGTFGPMAAAWFAAMFVICEIRKSREGK